MFKKKYLCSAITYALTAGMSFHVVADEQRELERIVVTASKRAENIQETPVTVQALNAEALAEQNIGNFDDFVRYMPNVSIGGRGPGQSDVFIRGMAIQPITVMLSGAQGTSPNVALYLDEQPVTAPGRNLDVYAADLERIEVLPGPQGTLFGASSQAGTIRYITHKPDLSGFSAGVKSSFSSTKSGETSNSVEGFFNFALTEQLAIRATFYNVNRGGYIDNVYGEFTLDPSINPNVADSVKALPGNTRYIAANNSDLVEEDFNDSYYKGFRLGVKYEFDADWQLLVQHTQQELGADGVFDYDPEVGDLKVQRFFDDELEDEFNQTSITLEGRLGDLQMVYTAGILDRDVEQSIDYTGYNNSGGFIPWYTCSYASETQDYRECLDPTKGFKGQQDHTRQTHEFRISTDIGERVKVIAGVFYDDYEIETQDDFLYLATAQLGFARNAPISGANNINPDPRPAGVAFFNDITRTEEQIAIFGEAAYRITDKLTATIGLRWYEIESDFTGSSNFAEKGVDGDAGRDYDASGGHTDEPLKIDDVITKFNLSYQYADNMLIYTTYSEGFRPGGFNRGGGFASANPDFPQVQVTYDTDDVTNYELGWKSNLLDNTLRLNANMYFIQWDNMQVSRFDPVNVSILTFIENAADAEIFGLEADSTWIVDDNWTLYGAMSYNNTELTSIKAEVVEMAPVGSELPLTPEIQANIRARYDWELGEYMANWQLGVQYADESYSSIVAEERELQDSYTLMNMSIAIEKDDWSVRLFIDNLTDERATLFVNTQDDIRRITTNRPRTIGVNFAYSFF